eukprot:1158106-Pelagomonas_calceolata.AAC.1
MAHEISFEEERVRGRHHQLPWQPFSAGLLMMKKRQAAEARKAALTRQMVRELPLIPPLLVQAISWWALGRAPCKSCAASSCPPRNPAFVVLLLCRRRQAAGGLWARHHAGAVPHQDAVQGVLPGLLPARHDLQRHAHALPGH